jgi:glucose-6-phosphate isomerase, archaeal
MDPGGREAVMKLDSIRPFQVKLDLKTGLLSPPAAVFVRRLSDMAAFYLDQAEVRRTLDGGEDPEIYSGYDAAVPDEDGQIVFRTTIINAGHIGGEYFMTKGHHHIRDTGELYVGMTGQGLMLMESREGEFASEELAPTAAVYVPPGWAHRTVNVGETPLAFLAAFMGNAGHDYDSIERRGFSRRVFAGPQGAELRPGRLEGTPRWA